MAPALQPGSTVRIKGEGGAMFDLDVPDPSTHVGELFAQRYGRREILVVDDDGRPLEPQPEYPPPVVAVDAVPEGKVRDVLDWVGDDLERAERALLAEEERGDDARSSLVKKLEALIAGSSSGDGETGGGPAGD